MKRGQPTKITVEGQTIPVTFLGKGAFTKAYRYDDGYVYLLVNDDYSKEALSLIGEIPHIPYVEKIEVQDNDTTVYRMKHYEKLTASHSKAWADYKALNSALNKARCYCPLDAYFGYSVNQYVVENAQVDGCLREALESLTSWLSSYGSSYIFEFPKRNLAVDNNGDLILLDVAFDMEAMQRKRKQKSYNYSF